MIHPVEPVTTLPRRTGANPPETSEQLLHRRDALPVGHPDRATLRTRIIEENLALSGRLARRYAGRGESHEDLAQVAALGLIKAVDGFDSGRGVPFSGYAIPTILGAIRRHFRDAAWAMRVPRSAQELGSRVARARSELTHRESRHPTDAELARHLDVGVDELRVALGAAQAYRLASLNLPPHGTDGVEPVGLVGAVDPGYAAVDDHLVLRPLFAALAPRERRILTMRFHGNMTQLTIAEKVGVSQMHVSRLLKRSLAELRSEMFSDDGDRLPSGTGRRRQA